MSLQRLILAGALALALPSHAATAIKDVKQVGVLYKLKVWVPSFDTQAFLRATAPYRSATLAAEQKKTFFQLYAGLEAAAHDQPMSAQMFERMPVQIGTTMFVLLLDAPRLNAHNAADVIADLHQVVEDGYFPEAAP